MKFSQELLRAVSEIELRSRRNVTALLSGDYRSAFRGSGMQFKEFRHYEAGDDIRHMSWPVTARTGRATIKIYEEERELDVVLAIDVSGSSVFGLTSKRKVDMYAELVALLGLGAIRAGDNVGLLLFNDKPVAYLPPRRTRDHVLVALARLLEQPMRGTRSDCAPMLRYANRVLRHRCLFILVSDFAVPPFEAELGQLCRRHEVVLLHGFDDAERGAQLQGLFEVCDPETGEFFVLDGSSARVRQRLSQHHTNLTNELESLSRKTRADYLTLSVEDDYLQRLVHFFRKRGPSRL